MEPQGFDPMEHTVNQAVEFMERIEGTEQFDANATKANKVTKASKNKSPSSHTNNNEKETPRHHCSHHGYCHHDLLLVLDPGMGGGLSMLQWLMKKAWNSSLARDCHSPSTGVPLHSK